MTDKKQNGIELVKKIGYILVIVLIFSPLTFLVSTTITGKVTDDCYMIKPSVPTEKGEVFDDLPMRQCEQEYRQAKDHQGQQEFLIVSIISIITIAFLLFLGKRIDPIISYSLFFAAALNTIIIVIKNASSSFLATGLGILLFVLVLVFINKNLRKAI